MPGSRYYGKAELGEWLHKQPKRRWILDVGCGRGSYQLKLYTWRRKDRWWGVEIWAPYVRLFHLEDRYRQVYIADIRHFDWRKKWFHLVIFGDVLEHMPKADAIRVVAKARRRAMWVAACIPSDKQQNPPIDQNPYNYHVAFWEHEEILETWPDARVLAYCPEKQKGMYLLPGEWKGRAIDRLLNSSPTAGP